MSISTTRTKIRDLSVAILLALSVLLGLAGCKEQSLKERYLRGDDISPELLQIELEYKLSRFPTPFAPSSYKICVTSDGVLSKEYWDAERYGEGYGPITKQLSQDELVDLIDIVIGKGFFQLPENVGGDTGMSDLDSSYLTITYNGKTHECKGINTINVDYHAICNYIEKLADN